MGDAMSECTTIVTWFVGIAWLEVFKAATTLIVGLGWPASIVFLGWLFRREIRKKFQDLETAGPSGVTFRRQEQRTAIDLKTLMLDAENHRPAVRAVEEPILQDLNKIKEGDLIAVLVNQLAVARLGRHFEEIYSIIFGSQIDGLQRLASANGTVSLEEAELYFETVRTREPEFYAQSSFGEWFAYLKGMNLAQITNDVISITELGREFLIFVADTKVGKKRPF